jgi:hypothetical protein
VIDTVLHERVPEPAGLRDTQVLGQRPDRVVVAIQVSGCVALSTVHPQNLRLSTQNIDPLRYDRATVLPLDVRPGALEERPQRCEPFALAGSDDGRVEREVGGQQIEPGQPPKVTALDLGLEASQK